MDSTYIFSIFFRNAPIVVAFRPTRASFHTIKSTTRVMGQRGRHGRCPIQFTYIDDAALIVETTGNVYQELLTDRGAISSHIIRSIFYSHPHTHSSTSLTRAIMPIGFGPWLTDVDSGSKETKTQASANGESLGIGRSIGSRAAWDISFTLRIISDLCVMPRELDVGIVRLLDLAMGFAAIYGRVAMI